MTERLSWASGPDVRDGWHHSDAEWYPGMRTDETYPVVQDHLGPIQKGLPWSDDLFDYCVSHHGLMMLPEVDLVPALVELRRVTKPRGWLRVSVPSLSRAVEAWRQDRIEWFPLKAVTVDDAICVYLTQGGATKSLFTSARLQRLMWEAGWNLATSALPGWTTSDIPAITELDSRPDESLFMEAVNLR